MAPPESYISIEDFMKCQEIKWFEYILEWMEVLFHKPLTYMSFFTGELMHKVFCQMGIPLLNNIRELREFEAVCKYNMEIVLENIRYHYEQVLGQFLVRLPNISCLINDPKFHMHELVYMLNLLIGCAQTCPNKNLFRKSLRMLTNYQVPSEVIDFEEFIAHWKSNRSQFSDQEMERITDYVRNMYLANCTLKEFVRKRLVLPTDEDEIDREDLSFSLIKVYEVLEDVSGHESLTKYISNINHLKEQEESLSKKIASLEDQLTTLTKDHEKTVKLNHDLTLQITDEKSNAKKANALALKYKKEAKEAKKLLLDLQDKAEILPANDSQRNFSEPHIKIKDIWKFKTEFEELANERMLKLVSENRKLKEQLEEKNGSSNQILQKNPDDVLNMSQISPHKKKAFDSYFKHLKDMISIQDDNIDMLTVDYEYSEMVKEILKKKLEKADAQITNQRAEIDDLNNKAEELTINKRRLNNLQVELSQLEYNFGNTSREKQEIERKYELMEKNVFEITKTCDKYKIDLQRQKEQLKLFEKQIRKQIGLAKENQELKMKLKKYKEIWRSNQFKYEYLKSKNKELERKISCMFTNMHVSEVPMSKENPVRKMFSRVYNSCNNYFHMGFSSHNGHELSDTFYYLPVEEEEEEEEEEDQERPRRAKKQKQEEQVEEEQVEVDKSDFISGSQFIVNLGDGVIEVDSDECEVSQQVEPVTFEQLNSEAEEFWSKAPIACDFPMNYQGVDL